MAGELVRDAGARVPFTLKVIVAAPESLAGQAKIIESRATAECINRLGEEFAGKTGVEAPFTIRFEIEPATAGR